MKINQMKKDEYFEGFYLIKRAEVRKTRAGKDYIAFTFQDDSGEISGNLWDAQPYNVEEFTAGKVVHMEGRREVYNNTPQVNQITLRFPAAKTNHHAFESGLAYHTATMVRLADSIGDVYPKLNKSLLFAGIMLHDLAKVIELTGPENTEYTVRGNLIGHIALIDEEITKVLMELNIDDTREDVVVLRHVILSHHGQLEYGSPVRPRIMEAELSI